MGFILGLLLGLLGAIGLIGFLAYWVCSRPDSAAVAKFLGGIADAMAHRENVPAEEKPSGPAGWDSVDGGATDGETPKRKR